MLVGTAPMTPENPIELVDQLVCITPENTHAEDGARTYKRFPRIAIAASLAHECVMRLEVSELACVRAGRPVFAGLSFALDKGEGLLVRGANGAGKSSLLRILAGLDEAQSGKALIGEERLSARASHYVAHSDAVKPAMTVAEHLRFFSQLLGAPDNSEERLAAALAALDLAALHDTPARYLSAGQKRRLALTRLLLARRTLWLLDEPTATLDSSSLHRFETIIAAHRAEGGMVIATTHEALAIPGALSLTLAAP